MDYIEVIKELGVPVAVLLGGALALWRGGKWVGEKLIVPMRDALISHLSTITQVNVDQADTLKTLAMTSQRQLELCAQNVERLDLLHEQGREHSHMITMLLADVRGKS